MKKALQTIENLIRARKVLKCHFFQNIFKLIQEISLEQKKLQTFININNNFSKQLFYCTTFGFITVGQSPEIEQKLEDENNDWRRERDISNHITEAQLQIKKGDLKKAEFILEKALILNNKRNTTGIAVIYDMLATLAYKQELPQHAANILEKGIEELTSNGLSPGHNSIVDFRLKLARLNSKLGNNKDAEVNFRKCLSIQKVKHGKGIRDEETMKLWINSLYWYGKHLVLIGKYSEARQCFDNAYILCAQVKSIGNDQVMVMLYNLGEVSYAIGDKDAALRHLLNAVILGRNINSPDLPMYFNKIGIVYMSKGILKEAKKWCETGKEKSQKLHNKEAQLEAEKCIKKIEEILKISPLNKA